MGNILEACLTIANNPWGKLQDNNDGRNRVNNVGKALELYIENSFAGIVNDINETDRLKIIDDTYSYLGNQNNPPDLMLKDGDAIEVKKIQSANSALALNSSYPKAKLFSDSSMITKRCKTCEDWSEKDIIYAVGHTTDNNLKSLWMVYGDCYAAEKDIYERIKNIISDGIQTIPDVDLVKTNEIAKVKRVDPLGITDLRVSGMWHITNPKNVFNYLYTSSSRAIFELLVLMRSEKYNSFPNEVQNRIASSELLKIKDVKIKDPNNPAKLLDAKLITFVLEDS